MSQEYSQKQLERMVMGAVEDPNCVFYEQSKMIPELSEKAGRRVYRTVLMVKYTQPGVTDWAPQRAQKEDIENNQEAYNYFMQTKGDIGSPSIDIIPGITPNEQQELIDYGLLTITKLCQAKTLPAHLQHVQASARRINEVFKHEKESNQKGQTEVTQPSDIERDTGAGQEQHPPVHQHIHQGEIQARRKAEDVPADRGRIDPHHVRQPTPETGAGIQEGKTSEGIRPARRIDSDQGTVKGQGKKVNGGLPSYNWSMSISYK